MARSTTQSRDGLVSRMGLHQAYIYNIKAHVE